MKNFREVIAHWKAILLLDKNLITLLKINFSDKIRTRNGRVEGSYFPILG
jgi:hypothetical protein